MTIHMDAWRISRSVDGHLAERRPDLDRTAEEPTAAVKAMTLANALALDPYDDITVFMVYDPDIVSNTGEGAQISPLPCRNCGKDPVWVKTPVGAGIACERWQCDENMVTARTMAEAVLKWNAKQMQKETGE